MTEGHRVSRGRRRRGDTADTHPENVPRMILKYFLNMIIFSGLTFGPAGQHVAEVDDSVGGVVVGDVRRSSLPERHLGDVLAHPVGKEVGSSSKEKIYICISMHISAHSYTINC